MDLVTLSQIANPILQTIFIAVIGLGYYYTVRATWATVREMRAEHTAGGGRPLITVSEDYANLPNISLIVQNVWPGTGQGHLLRVLRARRELGRSDPQRPALLRGGAQLPCTRGQDRLLLGHPRQPPSSYKGREDSLRHNGHCALQGPQSQPPGAQLGYQSQAL